jgi:hypothetical protein
MFLHETDAVVQKARSHATKRSSKALRENPTRNQSTINLSTSAPLKQPTHPQSLEAIGLFASAYAGGVYFEYLPVMYLQQSRPPSLEKSFEAVALVHMANEQRREDLRQLANQSYGDALSHLKEAIQCPQGEPSSETMASILLLALFEAFSTRGSRNVRDVWSTHVQGALAAISRCSSSAIFHKSVGQTLLHHIISVVQLDYILRQKPLPDQLRYLYSASWYKEGPQVQMWYILDRLATVNAQSVEAPITLCYLEDLQDLETNIQHLLGTMPQTYPDSFTFQDITQHLIGHLESDSLSIPIHQFQSFRIAQAWNTLRLMLLLTTTLLASGIDCYMSFDNILTEEARKAMCKSRDRASVTARTTAINICATVPQSLRPGNWLYDPETRVQYSAWARSLLWPLTVSRNSPHNSEELQNYIDKQLKILAVVAGVQEQHWESSDKETLSNDWYENYEQEATKLDGKADWLFYS